MEVGPTEFVDHLNLYCFFQEYTPSPSHAPSSASATSPSPSTPSPSAPSPSPSHAPSSASGMPSSGCVPWFVDDNNVYQVKIRKDKEGSLATKPINGAVPVLVARSGLLFLKVIHVSAWAGRAKLAQYAKAKAAEEVAALMRALPGPEQPTEIIITRRGLFPHLQAHLQDFPAVDVKGCELFIPFQALLRMDQFKEQIHKAEEPQLLVFHVYDEWLERDKPLDCFLRFLVILRALHCNSAGAIAILNANGTAITKKGHIWPHHQGLWGNIENDLKNLILADHCHKHGLQQNALSQAECSRIIFTNL